MPRHRQAALAAASLALAASAAGAAGKGGLGALQDSGCSGLGACNLCESERVPRLWCSTLCSASWPIWRTSPGWWIWLQTTRCPHYVEPLPLIMHTIWPQKVAAVQPVCASLGLCLSCTVHHAEPDLPPSGPFPLSKGSTQLSLPWSKADFLGAEQSLPSTFAAAFYQASTCISAPLWWLPLMVDSWPKQAHTKGCPRARLTSKRAALWGYCHWRCTDGTSSKCGGSSAQDVWFLYASCAALSANNQCSIGIACTCASCMQARVLLRYLTQAPFSSTKMITPWMHLLPSML